MKTPYNGELLLSAICDLIPRQTDATRILALRTTDYLTFAEAYCAVRSAPDFDAELRELLLDHMFELMDAETELIVAAR